MLQLLLTIISAIGAFCAFYLLGSSRQKDKDEKAMNEYKSKAEAEIRASKQETAQAEANERKSETEQEILKGTAHIITNPVIREKSDVDLQDMARKVETEEEVQDFLDAIKADAEKRAEEMGRRYE